MSLPNDYYKCIQNLPCEVFVCVCFIWQYIVSTCLGYSVPVCGGEHLYTHPTTYCMHPPPPHTHTHNIHTQHTQHTHTTHTTHTHTHTQHTHTHTHTHTHPTTYCMYPPPPHTHTSLKFRVNLSKSKKCSQISNIQITSASNILIWLTLCPPPHPPSTDLVLSTVLNVIPSKTNSKRLKTGYIVDLSRYEITAGWGIITVDARLLFLSNYFMRN